MESFLCLKDYREFILDGVKELAYSEKDQGKQEPAKKSTELYSFVISLQFSIQKCLDELIAQKLGVEDIKGAKRAKILREFHDSQYRHLSSYAKKAKKNKALDKDPVKVSDSDLKLLYDGLLKDVENFLERLKKNINIKNWLALADVCMVFLTLYCR